MGEEGGEGGGGGAMRYAPGRGGKADFCYHDDYTTTR